MNVLFLNDTTNDDDSWNDSDDDTIYYDIM